jgi:hypothetical protein
MNEEAQQTPVVKDNLMKTWLVNYVGEKLNPENDAVTVEMIVDVMSQEFPDFLLVVAQDNWIRGYQQALHDVEYGELSKNEQESTGISE